MSAEATVQLDFHSAGTQASDYAETVSMLLRDEYGVDFFAALAPPLNGVFPLHADDPRHMPFVNDSQQMEWRWILEAHLQVYQVIVVPSPSPTSSRSASSTSRPSTRIEPASVNSAGSCYFTIWPTPTRREGTTE